MDLTTALSVLRTESNVISAIESGYIHSFVKAMLIGTGLEAPLVVTLPLRPVDDLLVRTFLLKDMVMDKFCSSSLFCGNLLVVKHSRVTSFEPNFDLTDITLEDYSLVKPIMEWLVEGVPTASSSVYPYPPVTRLRMPLPLFADILRPFTPMESFFRQADDMLSLARVNQQLASYVRALYCARMRAILRLAFRDSMHKNFCFRLESNHSYIGGSAAYWIIDKDATYAVTNINVLAPCGTQDNWSKWLLSVGSRELFSHGFNRENFMSYANSFRVFLTPNGILLTISESLSSSVMPLLLSGDSTAEAVAIGCHVAYILYPTLMDNGIVLPTTEDYRIHQHLQRTYGERWTFRRNTRVLGCPCRESCPALWRSTDGYGVEKFRWGGLTNQGSFCRQLDWGGLEWRISERLVHANNGCLFVINSLVVDYINSRTTAWAPDNRFCAMSGRYNHFLNQCAFQSCSDIVSRLYERGIQSSTPPLKHLRPIFYAITLTDLNDDLLLELTTYLGLLDIASLSAVSKSLAATFIPVLYRSVNVSAFSTLSCVKPLVSRLGGQHPACFVRKVVVGSSRREVFPSTIQAGFLSLDSRAKNACLLYLEIWSLEFTLADVFARSPARLAPTALRLQCPLIAGSARKSLAIMRSLVTTNLTSLTVYFPFFTPQLSVSAHTRSLHKMFTHIMPALVNVVFLDLWLNTVESDTVPLRKNGEPQPNTLASAFTSDWFFLPSLRCFVFRDSLYDVPLHAFLSRHPLINNLTIDIDNFDWRPIPDLDDGGVLPRLLEFSGTLPNVSCILRSWSTTITTVNVVGPRSSEHELQLFLKLIPTYPNIVCLRLLVADGYRPDVLHQLLSACSHVESLTVLLDCPLNSTFWIRAVGTCMALPVIRDVQIRTRVVDAQFIRRHAYETLRLLLAVDGPNRFTAGVCLTLATEQGIDEVFIGKF
ncbi:hypothetical protein F5877DRAFT_66305 [Lentinula edodes]|nr:hypothetical protein F5877DRAFT_66305 [Lentinula edodes]